MDITITISDEKINEIIRDNINGISKDRIADAILEGIKQYLSGDNGKQIIEKIMYDGNYYRNSLTEAGKEIISKTLDKEQINELQGLASDIIEKHAKDIIVEAIVRIILDNISDKLNLSRALWNNPDVIESIKSMTNTNNNGGY